MSPRIISDAEHEHLHATRKRLMDLPAERIIDVQTPPAAALTLASAHGETAQLREAVLAFLRAVNELCDGVLRKQGRANRSAVQAAEAGFALLAAELELGTEEPVAYLRGVRDARAAARQLDVAAVEAAIAARAAARASKDFATADRLQRELVAQGVVLHDHAHGTDWSLPA
jgi:cysteinyl-tRNA synthetase